MKTTDRVIWEGWTVNDFIEDLDWTFHFYKFETKEELKQWCKDTQPYYKKHIPEVYRYFLNKYTKNKLK